MIELGNDIRNYFLKHFGDEFLVNYLDYIYKDHNTFIRLHPDSTRQKKITDGIRQYDINLTPVEGMPRALKAGGNLDALGKTMEYILGQYYIQSLSSMIPPLVLNPSSTDKVLDLCAAPGSKTSQLSEMMDNKGQLYANELVGNRVKILVHNMEKFGLANIGVIKHRGEGLSNYFDEYFDKILVDAPCSALGILQKKGEVSNWWKDDIAERMSEMQFKLLVSAIKMAKVGGEIVYSTCTLTLEENELLLNKILDKYPVKLEEIELPVKSQPAFTKYGNEQLNPTLKLAHRIIPWEINSEGFFIAKLRKLDITNGKRPRKKGDNIFLSPGSKKIKPHLETLSDQFGIDLDLLNQYKYFFRKKELYFVHEDWDTDHTDIFERIGLKFAQFDSYGNVLLKNYPVRVFEDKFTDNIIDLNDLNDIKTYFDGRTLKGYDEVKGKKIIKIRGDYAGVAAASKEGLKSQFPRSLRTSEILYPRN